jgi:hypothetical protein
MRRFSLLGHRLFHLQNQWESRFLARSLIHCLFHVQYQRRRRGLPPVRRR